MVSGKNCLARFIIVGSFKFRRKGWCRAQLNGSGKLFGRFSENSKAEPPRWNHDNQLEDGCRNKIWDPGIHEDPLWKPLACVELHQSLKLLILNFGAY